MSPLSVVQRVRAQRLRVKPVRSGKPQKDNDLSPDTLRGEIRASCDAHRYFRGRPQWIAPFRVQWRLSGEPNLNVPVIQGSALRQRCEG